MSFSLFYHWLMRLVGMVLMPLPEAIPLGPGTHPPNARHGGFLQTFSSAKQRCLFQEVTFSHCSCLTDMGWKKCPPSCLHVGWTLQCNLGSRTPLGSGYFVAEISLCSPLPSALSHLSCSSYSKDSSSINHTEIPVSWWGHNLRQGIRGAWALEIDP